MTKLKIKINPEANQQWETNNRTEFYGINPSANYRGYMEKLEYLDILLNAPQYPNNNYPMYRRLKSIYLLLLKLEGRLPMAHSLVLTKRLPLKEMERLVDKIHMLYEMKSEIHKQFGFVSIAG
jgi:hypothetical protein